MIEKKLGRAFLLFSNNGTILNNKGECCSHWRVAFRSHRNNKLHNLPYTAKTWKSLAGVKRWLGERTFPAGHWSIVEVNLDTGKVIAVHQPGNGTYAHTGAEISEILTAVTSGPKKVEPKVAEIDFDEWAASGGTGGIYHHGVRAGRIKIAGL